MNSVPKVLSDPAARRSRMAMLDQPHVRALADFVHDIRRLRECGQEVPFFDPLDGGVHARCLFLLEAPGAKAVLSGFVSRDNPDESAKNFLLLNIEACIPRRWTVCWNIVPWYLGSGGKIRAAEAADVAAGLVFLERLLSLLLKLEIVVLVGGKAQQGAPWLGRHRPDLRLFHCPHPSPVFVNRHHANRLRIRDDLRVVASYLNNSNDDVLNNGAWQDV